MEGEQATNELRFRTKAGSRIRVFGEHLGCYEIDFDWLEEGACMGSRPSIDISDRSEPWLTWDCDCCDGGMALMTEAGDGG